MVIVVGLVCGAIRQEVFRVCISGDHGVLGLLILFVHMRELLGAKAVSLVMVSKWNTYLMHVLEHLIGRVGLRCGLSLVCEHAVDY